MVLGGVIYLHDISQDRFSGTAKKNLEMFHVLCGDAALRKVVLVTTKWDRLREEHGKNREKELKTIHWQSLIKNGAHVHPFRGNYQNAWEIIDLFLKQVEMSIKPGIKTIVLQIQTEMVDARKIIPQTKAGKKLRNSLEELLYLQQRVATLEAELAKSGNAEAQAKLQETEENMESIVGQIQALRASLPQRVLRLFRVLASDPQELYSTTDSRILSIVSESMTSISRRGGVGGQETYLRLYNTFDSNTLSSSILYHGRHENLSSQIMAMTRE